MTERNERPEERLSVFIDADLKDALDDYIKEHGHTQKWIIAYLIRGLLQRKIAIKGETSKWRRRV